MTGPSGRPLVSVIIPVFNGKRYLAAALESVFAQTYAPVEIIVVDDGSVDGTAEVAEREPRVIYVRQSNQGVAAARNTGVACSEGEFLAFLDADDLWRPEKLTRQVEHLMAHPEAGFAFTHQRLFLSSDIEAVPSWIRPEHMGRDLPGYVPSALLVRRKVFEAVGGFDPAYRVGEDTDWFFRARDMGMPLVILPETLLLKRVHDSNLTARTKEGRANILAVVRASLARRDGSEDSASPPARRDQSNPARRDQSKDSASPPARRGQSKDSASPPARRGQSKDSASPPARRRRPEESGAAGGVSVIIPVWNGERYLAQALESVVTQTHLPLEVLVVDDGSSDGSARLAETYHPLVRCIRQEHAGIGAARNRGVSTARGGYLAFLDADDLWERDKLKVQVGVLRTRPEVDAVFGHTEHFISPEVSEERRASLVCPDQPMPGFQAGAMLIRRDAFLKVGLFATGCQMGEFLDWYARARSAGLNLAMLPESLTRRRIHGDNHSLRHKERLTDYALILKTIIDRRRGAAEGEDA